MPTDAATNGRNDLYRENKRQLEALKRQGPREVYGVLLDGVSMVFWYIDRYGSDGWRNILSTKSFEEIVQAYIDAKLKEGGVAAAGGPARPRETLLYEDNRKSLDALQKQQPRQMHGILLDYNQMETWYVARYGMDGWHQILSTKPLEQIIQDYVNEQLKAQKARNTRQAGNGRAQTAAADSPEAAVPILPDEDDDILYVPLSTLTEQELLDEQERQDTTRDRRQEIDDTLEAIQAAREQALEEGLYFGEETAEDIAGRMRGSRARGGNDSVDGPAGTSSSGVAPVPVVIPEWGGEPGEPSGPAPSPDGPHHLHHGGGAYGDYGAAGPGGDHSMDFDPFLVMEGLNDGGRDTGDGAPGRDTGDGQRGRDTGSGQQGTSSGSPARSDGEDDGAIAPVPPMYGPEGAAEGELPSRSESPADDEESDSDGPSKVPHISGNGLSQNATTGADDEAAKSDGETDGDESVRDVLNDDGEKLDGGPGSLLENNPVADAAKQAARKKMRILVLHALSAAAPFIIGLLFVVMIVACINDKLGGGSGGDASSGSSTTATTNAAAPTMDAGVGGGGGGSGSAGGAGSTGASGSGSSYVTQQRNSTVNGLPKVYIDPNLRKMFEQEEEEEATNNAGTEVADFAASLTLNAVGCDITDKLKSLDLYGNSAGKYTCENGMLCAHNGEGSERGHTSWIIPNPKIPHAQELIDMQGIHPGYENGATSAGRGKTKDGKKDMTGRGVYADCAAMPWDVWQYFHSDLNFTKDFGNDAHTKVKSPSAGGQGMSARQMIGPSGRKQNDNFEFIMTEAGKSWEEQCLPGDILCSGAAPHYMLFVGNEIAQKYWPGTTGCIAEASHGAQGLWSITDGRWHQPDGQNWFIVRYLHDNEGEPSGGSGGGGGSISDGTMTAAQQAVVNACKTTPSAGVGYCAAWVTYVYNNAGVGNPTGNACDMYSEFCTSSNKSDLKPGMLIAVSTHPHTIAGSIYGHIGIYIGNGMMMDNVGDIRTISVDEWIDYYSASVPVKWGFGPGLP